MYFWNIKKLKQALITNTLSQNAIFGYILISVVLTEIVIDAAFYIPAIDVNLYDAISSFANIMIYTVGTIIVFKYNGGGNGQDFADRYFSIGFVVAIRLMVFTIPLLVIIVLFFWGDGGEEPMPTTLIDVAVVGGWSIIYFSLFAKHVSEVAHYSKSTT